MMSRTPDLNRSGPRKGSTIRLTKRMWVILVVICLMAVVMAWQHVQSKPQFQPGVSHAASGKIRSGNYRVRASFTTNTDGRPDVLTIVAPANLPATELTVVDDSYDSRPMTARHTLTGGTHTFNLTGGIVQETLTSSGYVYRTACVVQLGPQGAWLILVPRARLVPATR